MEVITLGDPFLEDYGSITPIIVPSYEAEEAVIELTTGYDPYIIREGSGTSSYWSKSTSTNLHPILTTDKVVIGGISFLGSEVFRTVGGINITRLTFSSESTYINSIKDENDLVSDDDHALATQQSVKAYVDSQIISGLQIGDNISLLTNDVPYLDSETDPIFVASDAYSITSTQITNWDTSYGWGNHASAGYVTVEQDPIFSGHVSYTITSTNITNWDTAYTNNHTHSNKSLLDSITSVGGGTSALFDDGTYKTVATVLGGSDSYVQYNDADVLGGDSTFTFNDITKTLTVTNAYITQLDFNSVTSTTYIYEDGSGNISFVDAISGEYTLADLIGGASNYWTPITSGIYYTDYVGVNDPASLTAALTVNGDIHAGDFDSENFRYTSTNLLLGPNAGDNEVGSDKLYIHNTDTAYPLIYGEFTNALLQFNGDVYIAGTKTLNFINSDVRIYRTSDQLAFLDTVANSGAEILLTELIDGTYNVLASDFTDLPAVLSITAANKSQWNTAYSLSHSHIDGVLDWNGTTGVYEPYSSQQTALVSFDTSATTPVLTTRLNANCNLYTTNLYSGLISYNELDWTGGNVIYVPLSGDIQTYITNATAGDTLVLASGVYTITSTLTVDKQLNIVGQGRSGFVTSPVTPSHGTLISSSTASIVGFMLTNDNIRLSDLSINLTGDDSVAIQSSANLQGIVFNDIDIIVDCIGTARGFYLENTDTILRDITFYITSSDGIATGIYIHNNGSATKDSVVDAFNVTGIVQGATTYAYALACWNNNTAYTITLNLYNSVCTALAGTALNVGVASFSQTTSNSIVNAYMCTIDGQDYDVYQNNSNELNIGGSVIVHDSIFGTITYRTRVTAGNLTTNVIKTSGITQTAGYFDTGSSAPTDYADRLNYSGNFYSTNLFVTNKLTVGGLIDPTGLQLTPTGSNPGDSNTLWSNSGDSNKLYYGSSVANTEYTFSSGLTNTSGTITLGGEATQDIDIYATNHYISLFADDGSISTAELNIEEGDYYLAASSGGESAATNVTNHGLEYADDYSTNYTDRSLVDKGYVDSVISGVTPADNILDWDSGNSWYAPYSSISSTDLILSNVSSTSTQNATGYLNVNGQLIVGSTHVSNDRIAISGTSNSSAGISGSSDTGAGISGSSNVGVGIYGSSIDNTGIYGISTNSVGIQGNSASNIAIQGVSSTSVGVQGVSTSGIGGLFRTTSGSIILQCKYGSDIKNYIDSSGKVLYTAGTSTTFVIAPGVLKDFYADASTSSTDETDLYSYTVPANVLASNGDKLTAEYAGTITSATVGIIKIYFAGTLIGTSSYADSDDDFFKINIEIIRISSSVARCSALITVTNDASKGTSVTSTEYVELTSKDWTTTNILKITGEAQVSGSITTKLGYIEYKPAAIN
jgi:hypothetical protein